MTTNIMTNIGNIQDAIPYLHHGDIKKVATKAGFSWRTVQRVLNEETDNPHPSIILAILEQANENKLTIERINELSERLKSK